MVSSLRMTDEEVIKSFPADPSCPAVKGFIVDFLGTKTRTSYICDFRGHDGFVEGYPIPASFHATAMEWAGVLRAVLEASDELVVFELGAGWAPWLVSAARAAQIRGIPTVRLVGVEGSKEHCDFMACHFADNGLDPSQHKLLHGVVGTTDGVAEFPVLADPTAGYGAQAVYSKEQPAETGPWLRRKVRAAFRSLVGGSGGSNGVTAVAAPPSQTVRVPCFSLATLLRPFPRVDLVHVDIQGDEYDVIRKARRVLKDKVKRLVIGTHGRGIEQNLLDELAAQNWVLEAEECCKHQQFGQQMLLVRDGCQVWRNQALEQ